MERALPAGRLGRRRPRPPRRGAAGLSYLASVGRVLWAILALLRRGIVALVAGGRRHPRRAGALLAVVAVLAGAWLVVRSSSLSAVQRVQVQGLSGMHATAIDAALVTAAQRQSTLGVDVGALRAAVASYHLVSALHVSASFPHTLRIVVVEQLPVAVLRYGAQRVVVAADGSVLDPSVAQRATPTIVVSSLPSAHVSDPHVLAELTILGAAPPVLLRRVARVYSSPNGLTALMRNGLLIFFGDDALVHAKWLSAARVIASPLASGATYVDVRVPDHPAAGGLPAGSAVGDASAETDATDASIAAALTGAMTSGTSVAPSPSAATATGAADTQSSPSAAPTTGDAGSAATDTSTVAGTASGTATGTGTGASAVAQNGADSTPAGSAASGENAAAATPAVSGAVGGSSPASGSATPVATGTGYTSTGG